MDFLDELIASRVEDFKRRLDEMKSKISFNSVSHYEYQLSDMLILATQAHDGQTDKGGKPYILHCLKVMEYLNTDDEELQCIALGHDLIEDTDVTFHQLYMSFSSRIADAIGALTRRKDENYKEYIARVKTNPDAVKVKICDLHHNMDLSRLPVITNEDLRRNKKYRKVLDELQEQATKDDPEWMASLKINGIRVVRL